jgi:hypothetical protein
VLPLETKKELLKILHTKCKDKSVLSLAFSTTWSVSLSFFLCFTFSFLFPFGFVGLLIMSHPVKRPLIFTERELIWFNRNTIRRLVGKQDRTWESASRKWRPGEALTSDSR